MNNHDDDVTIINKDNITSISIYNNNDDDNIIISDLIKGRIKSINGISLNSLEVNNDYVSLLKMIMKGANINTLEIKENIIQPIINDNDILQFELLYIDNIIDNQSLGIGVTYNIYTSESLGLKIISIQQDGLLYQKLGSKLRVGDTIINVNGISLELISTNVACKLLNDTINRKITILHRGNHVLNDDNYNDYNHNTIKQEWAIQKYNYLENRIKKDTNDIKSLSYKYNLRPRFRKYPRLEHQQLLSSYHKYLEQYRT